MSSDQLIANELLAFIQNAIDTKDEVSILQICKSNFKEDEVCSGKALLFRFVGKADKMPSRRRDGTEKSVQDIITLLKETDPDDVPTFVAKELHKLPPVTFDRVDVTRLLKDINFLKATLADVVNKLEDANNNIGELRAQVDLLSNNACASRSPEASNVNTRRGAQNASVGSIESAPASASPAAATASDASRLAAAARPSVTPETSRACTSTPQRAYAAAAASRPVDAVPNCERRSKQQTEKSSKLSIQRATPAASQKRISDEKGFIKVERKKRKPIRRNLCGAAPTGPNHLLRPAIPPTPLYVSRLHYSTKEEEIVEYLRIKTNFSLRVARLESRHNVNFNSFVVRVPTEHQATFMKEDFWPKGVVFRRFRGRLPDTTPRHTSPSIRVN
ncbi:unnamed protein product [Chilo suppressalis]|uniref:Mutant cadherin n=1 Tax=Chilo suppressalis TaxID=168631 RepID=A0ABN8B2L3_CHISP|nr:unnamed protein product [Chilo suppressalis]